MLKRKLKRKLQKAQRAAVDHSASTVTIEEVKFDMDAVGAEGYSMNTKQRIIRILYDARRCDELSSPKRNAEELLEYAHHLNLAVGIYGADYLQDPPSQADIDHFQKFGHSIHFCEWARNSKPCAPPAPPPLGSYTITRDGYFLFH